MCTILSSDHCGCTATRGHRSILTAAALTCGSAVLLALWWLTGPQVIGRRRRVRRYRRYVHAAARILATLTAVAAVLYPTATAIVAAALAVSVGSAAVVTRRRATRARVEIPAAPRPPLRVAVDTGWPARRTSRTAPATAHAWYGAPEAPRTSPRERTPR